MIDLHAPDDLLDVFRIFLFVLSAYSAVVLVLRYRREGADWNTKTKDIWYGSLMWSIAGCIFVLQAIALDRPFTAATVFMTAAILVTGKGVHGKGPWGGNAT